MEDSTQGKQCPKCDVWKPYSEYHRNRSKADGYQVYCKLCLIAANAASRDKRAGYWRAHYAKHMRDTYPERGAERRAKATEWYAEKGREWHKRYRAEHPEVNQQARRKWQATERNSSNAIRRRRANKVGNGGSHTEAQWQALAASYDFCCAACGKRPGGVWPDVLCRDHVVPLTLGGTDDIGNIQPLCNLCNVTKGNRRSTDYRRR